MTIIIRLAALTCMFLPAPSANPIQFPGWSVRRLEKIAVSNLHSTLHGAFHHTTFRILVIRARLTPRWEKRWSTVSLVVAPSISASAILWKTARTLVANGSTCRPAIAAKVLILHLIYSPLPITSPVWAMCISVSRHA